MSAKPASWISALTFQTDLALAFGAGFGFFRFAGGGDAEGEKDPEDDDEATENTEGLRVGMTFQ